MNRILFLLFIISSCASVEHNTSKKTLLSCKAIGSLNPFNKVSLLMESNGDYLVTFETSLSAHSLTTKVLNYETTEKGEFFKFIDNKDENIFLHRNSNQAEVIIKSKDDYEEYPTRVESLDCNV